MSIYRGPYLLILHFIFNFVNYVDLITNQWNELGLNKRLLFYTVAEKDSPNLKGKKNLYTAGGPGWSCEKNHYQRSSSSGIKIAIRC